MPNEDPANKDGQQDDAQGKVPREHVRHLEEKAGKYDAEKERTSTLERENAFLKAGVDLDDPRAAYLVSGYKGELDKESIQNEAKVLGLLGDESSEADGEQDAPSREEQDFDDAASDAASGSPGDQQPEDHPSVTANKVADQVVERGGTREAALAASVSVLGEAAVNGDNRVLWTPGQ